jgi:hypothetical protein
MRTRPEDADDTIPEFDLSNARPARHYARAAAAILAELAAAPEPQSAEEYAQRLHRLEQVMEWGAGERARLLLARERQAERSEIKP